MDEFCSQQVRNPPARTDRDTDARSVYAASEHDADSL